ncbi:Uncharacterised protein [BD1-7 clade bacterium]|uniref:Phage tail protein X n=1 Tax=BD1-7 clade bacterium TaxID=2029982 RepID=A0A5S9QTY0_9GAMM|nr:Uncharacterised protein [BD1-7 clade bacterium]CAA0122807.1 Uncharacterised protein [BD1-7 clade bacterium]
MHNYQTQPNDMIDAICTRQYPGIDPDQAINAVLDANPGLAAHGPILPDSIIIQLPEITATEIRASIQLWD